MNILFLTANTYIREELQEYLNDMQGKAYFANTPEDAISLLHAQSIDIAVVDVKRITDIQVLKYIYKYFDHIRIVLAVERNMEKAISTIKHSQFGILHKPFKLEELGELISQQQT